VRKKQSIVLQNVLVEDYAAEGKSLAKLDGKVIFIENVVPGDVVDVRLGKNKKDWAEGYPVQFHSYSKERVEPFCQHFGVCGGCQWQMLPYAKQLEYKQKQVYDNLKRIGKIDLPEMMPTIGSEDDKFYRNKLEYTFSTKEYTAEKPSHPTPQRGNSATGNYNVSLQSGPFERGEVLPTGEGLGGASVLGFHAKGFFDKIVDIKKCWLQDDLTNDIRNGVREFALKNNLSFYDIRAHRGLLRTMQVRTNFIYLRTRFGISYRFFKSV
jgi:23S rRNA (uracil1939-C5)-methyltransferase